MMNLVYIRYFSAVVRTGSITAAAKEMDVSQPAVSYAIRELESEFGLALFVRKNKALRLTSDGKRLYDILSPCIDCFDEAVKRAHAYAKSKSTIHIGIPLGIGSNTFASLTPKFQGEFPNIKTTVHELGYRQAAEDVASGRIDLAVQVYPPTFSRKGVKMESTNTTDLCFAVSNSHPLANREFISFEEIGNTPIALPDAESILTQMAMREFESRGMTPNLILSSSQFSTILEIIHYGSAGTFLFPDRSQASTPWLRLIRISPNVKASVGFFYRDQEKPSEDVKQIINYTLKFMGA